MCIRDSRFAEQNSRSVHFENGTGLLALLNAIVLVVELSEHCAQFIDVVTQNVQMQLLLHLQ